MALARYARSFGTGSQRVTFPFVTGDGDTGDEPITLVALIRPTGFDGTEPLTPVALAPDTAGGLGRRLRIANPGLTFTMADTSGTSSSTTAAAASGQWALVSVSRDTAGNVNTHIFRFDTGVWAHQTRGTLTRSAAETSGTWVVGNGRAGAPFDQSFVGEILAVGVWQQVLSDAQVASLVETDRCKLSTWLTVGSPVHIWGFTQASTGSAVTDLKGSATQSSLTGTTVFDAGSASLPWDADVGGPVALAGTSAGTSSATGSLAGLPDAPSGVIGVPGPGSASVSFVAPYNGGSAILEYQAEAIQAVLLAGSSAGSSSARGVLSGGAASLVSSGLPTFTAGPVRSTTAPVSVSAERSLRRHRWLTSR
jgi:hypothetical protein